MQDPSADAETHCVLSLFTVMQFIWPDDGTRTSTERENVRFMVKEEKRARSYAAVADALKKSRVRMQSDRCKQTVTTSVLLHRSLHLLNVRPDAPNPDSSIFSTTDETPWLRVISMSHSQSRGALGMGVLDNET